MIYQNPIPYTMSENGASKKILLDWEYNSFEATEALGKGLFSESVDYYIKALEYVPHDSYNLLYDRIVESYSGYIRYGCEGEIPIDIEPLAKLTEETDRYTLSIYEPYLGIMEGLLKSINESDTLSCKMGIFEVANSMARQFFAVTTSLGSYAEACEYMIAICDKLATIPQERQFVISAYKTLYQALNSKLDTMTGDPDICIECSDEWRFTGNERVYVRNIESLYQITESYIREKVNDDSLLTRYSSDLDQFESEYKAILD